MKNLTIRYSVTQFSYWAGRSGATSFATAYFLDKGVPSRTIGVLLALGGLLSFLFQPFLASIVDRSERFILTKMMLIMSALSAVCFAAQLLPGLPLAALGMCYVLGIWCSDAMHPLINALNVAYNNANYPINYNAARGIGSIATAVSSLLIGFVVAQFGSEAMFIHLAIFRTLCIIAIAGYPKIEKVYTAEKEVETSCTVTVFFFRYKWYCISLLGVLMLGMYHAMTENYLIVIMERLGGNSNSVGMALFISAIVTFPVIFFFGSVRKRISDVSILKIAALSFLLKSILFFFAEKITTIYMLQLLQITSYAFLAPTQVYYANAKVRPTDMAKGQAFITAAYALGCSVGNYAGGQLLVAGIDALLISGIVMVLIGTIVLFLSVNKSDFNNQEEAS